MSRVGPWHEGHILGGYQNPKCASCQREERTRLRYLARLNPPLGTGSDDSVRVYAVRHNKEAPR